MTLVTVVKRGVEVMEIPVDVVSDAAVRWNEHGLRGQACRQEVIPSSVSLRVDGRCVGGRGGQTPLLRREAQPNDVREERGLRVVGPEGPRRVGVHPAGP